MKENVERAKGRRIFRLITIVGGLAALAWAMRDRLISIEAPREEAPPAFRTSNGARS